MSETASIYVHLDWHIGHYVKILMDEVFGEDAFINEIVWAYRSGGASKTTSIARKHDNIYFYTNNPGIFRINTIKERQYLEKNFIDTSQDEQGRFYVDTILTDTLSGVVNRVMSDGSIKEYNCRPVLNVSKERLGYATQKPLGLLNLLIEIASEEGMVIADFFCGSGVTARAAIDLNRKFIACDVGVNALQCTRDRLAAFGASFDVVKINDGLRLFRNPTQTTAKLFHLVDGIKSNTELDLGSFWDGGIARDDGSFTPVKFSGIHELLTKELLDFYLEEIYKLDNVASENSQAMIIYAHKIQEIDQKYVNQSVSKAARTELEVTLISLDNLLAEKRDSLYTPDNANINITKCDNRYEVTIKEFFSPYLFKKLQSYNKKRSRTSGDYKPVTLSEDGLEMIESVQIDTTLSNVWKSNPELEDKSGNRNSIRGVYQLDTDQFKIKIRNIAGDEIVIDSKNIGT